MLKFFLILILFNRLEIYKAQEAEECSVGNLENIAEKSSSMDTDLYYFKVENTKNIKDAKVTMCDGGDFVETEIGEDFVAAKVKNIDGLEESIENSRNSKLLCFRVYMDCKNTNIEVLHLLHDSNNHDPSFIDASGKETSEFTFTLPMPFPGTVSLDEFGDRIRAKDIDFTNLGMTFEIEALDGEDNLKIEYGTVEPKMKKIHTAVLRSTKSLNFDERKYRITAKDSGIPQRQTTAIITLKKNKENSVAYPAFEKTYYKGFYDTQQNTIIGLPAINLFDGEGAQVSLEEEEFRENFVPVYEDGIVGIEVGRPLEDGDDNVIVLSLDASVKNEVRPAKTVVVLEITGRTTTQAPTTTTTELSTTTQSTTTTEGENSSTGTTPTTTTEGENPGTITTTTESENPGTGTTPTTTTTEGENPSTGTTPTTTTTEGENPGTGTTPTTTTTTEGENPGTGTTPTTTTTEGENPGTGTTPTTTTTEGENPGTGTTPTTTTTEGENPGTGTTPTTTTTEGENPGTGTTPTTTTTEGENPGTGTTPTTTTTTEGENPGTGTTPSTTTTEGENPGTGTTPSTTTTEGENPGGSTPSGGTTTTCSPGIETTTSTTTTDKPAIVKFVDYSVDFTFNPKDKIPANINTFLATSTDPRDSIIYKPVSFPTGLSVDPKSGVFSVVSDVESGKHRLVIEAVGSYSGQKDTAQFVLTVGSTIACGGEEQTVYSFLVRKIKEKQPVDVVVVAPNNKEYEYCIFNQYPNNGKFYVNKDTKNVECESLDREDKIFKDMPVPQYSLILKLQKRTEDGICVEDPQSSYESDWEFIEGINMYEKIKNSPTQTVINVLIDDVNDHSPVFEKDEITVCYPEKDIAKEIRPSYLTKVFATDEDAIESTFGVIKYSSESSQVVVREDGVIYPTDSIYSKGDKFEFDVVATDGGGKTGKQKIKVKIIEDENIGILTLPNIPMDKVEEELEKLSKESNLVIRMLSSAGVPYKNSEKTRSNFYQQVYIYGMKNNDPVEIKDVKEKLENVEIIKYESTSKEIILVEEAEVTGWIAAVSVLSVLLVILLCGGIAFWYFKLRTKTTTAFDTFDSKVGEPTTFDNQESFDGGKRGTRRQTGYVYNPPPAEEEADANTYSAVEEPTSYDNPLYQSEDELKERRKSVSFNDQIERIKISKTEPSNDDEDERKEKKKTDL